MRFSLVISVLGLSLAVIATPVDQFQSEQSIITCKYKLSGSIGELSTLRDTNLNAVKNGDYRTVREIQPVVMKYLKSTFNACMKVAHVSNKEAAEFEDLIMKVSRGAEELRDTDLIDRPTIEDITTLHNHFHDICPEEYKEVLGNHNAGTSPSG